MTSSILAPRSNLTLCSPNTQRIPSVTLLLPLPLGPTMAVTPGTNSNSERSAKDLKPIISNRFRCIPLPPSYPEFDMPVFLQDPTPQGNLPIRADQGDFPVFQNHAENEHLRHKIGNLERRKIGHSDHLTADQIFRFVQLGNLGTAFANPQCAKVDPQSISRFPGPGKGFRPDHLSHPHLNLFKIGIGHLHCLHCTPLFSISPEWTHFLFG